MKKLKFREQPQEKKLLCLDLGTGKGANKPEGFVGVDLVKDKAVDKVCDLRKPWPWKSNSVDEIQANYVIQYFKPDERVHFMNEAFRVLKSGGKMAISAPHWCASKAYGDITAHYPPIGEAWFQFLNKASRENQNCTDQAGYTCDFDMTLGYGMHPAITTRNQEYQQESLTWKKEAAQDILASLIKR